MSTYSIPNSGEKGKNHKFNTGIHLIKEFYNDKLDKLVYHLYEEGYTQQKVADILGISKQAVNINFPGRKNVS